MRTAPAPSWVTKTLWPEIDNSAASDSAESVLSSATTMRCGSSFGVAVGAGVRAASAATKGSSTSKVAPWPTPSLAARSVPPCRLTSVRDSARPMPRPLCAPSP